MKKTIVIVSFMTAATAATFTSCQKEVKQPSQNVIKASPSVSNELKKPLGYIGQSTLGDSSKTKINP